MIKAKLAIKLPCALRDLIGTDVILIISNKRTGRYIMTETSTIEEDRPSGEVE